MNDKVPAKEQARGKWYSILRHLGVEDRYLDKKNGPCPLCGGERGSDRFRWKDTSGRGEYFCNQCGPDDGFQLLMKLHCWTFSETARRVEKFLGDGPATLLKSKPKYDPAIAINKVISESRAITINDDVAQYLKGRGLHWELLDLLFHPNLFEAETRKKLPAMIALVRNVEGVVVCVHRTYIEAGEKAKINSPRKLMPTAGRVTGAAIRLFSASSHIGIAEGIETAIAAKQLFNIPVWSVISATGVTTFEPPESVNEVTVYGDNDCNFTGQSAAYHFANRLSLKGIKTHVRIPDVPGQDWADVLMEKQEVVHGM